MFFLLFFFCLGQVGGDMFYALVPDNYNFNLFTIIDLLKPVNSSTPQRLNQSTNQPINQSTINLSTQAPENTKLKYICENKII
jgi:hypothetical protein